MTPVEILMFACGTCAVLGFLAGKIHSSGQVVDADCRAQRYANAVDDLDKWCGYPFPAARIIARHLKAHGEGGFLNAGTPCGEEACTVQGLRTQLARLQKNGADHE